MVTRAIVLRPEGLGTDPNELSDVPKGTLRRAENCVMRRLKMLGPRNGFASSVILEPENNPASVELRQVIPRKSTTISYLLGLDSGGPSGDRWRLYDAGDSSELTTPVAFAPLDPNRIGMRFEEARGSIYLCSTAGIRKITGMAPEALPTGLYPPRPVAEWTDDIAGNAVPSDSAVAYRLVLRRTDSNGYEVRSFPSNRRVVRNTLGSARDYLVEIAAIDGAEAGDVVEVYRSRPTAAATDTPEDELYLATEYTLTSADVTALETPAPPYARLTIRDVTPDGYLGRSLYTSPSQRGLVGGYLPPPIAHDLVLFRGSLFYFRLKLRHRISIALENLGGTYIEGLYNEDGLKVTRFTGDLTSGSPIISGVSSGDMAKLRVGMALADGSTIHPDESGSFIPADTLITALDAGAGEVTMSEEALSTISSRSLLQAHDTVSVGGTVLYALADYDGTNVGFHVRGDGVGTTLQEQMSKTATNLTEAINSLVPEVYAFVEELDGGGASTIVIESTAPDLEPFALTSSAPNAFSPLADGLLSKAEDQPGGYAWSEADLPEAVPISNYAFAGDPEAKILRAVGTRDAIWLFKEDGLFRLTGFGADAGWRVDPIDPSLKLIAPNSVAVLEEVVFAWTSRGVMMIGGGASSVPISSALLDKDLLPYERSLVTVPSQSGIPWGEGNPRTREYVLSVAGSGVSGQAAEAVYVWNMKTQSWTRWARTPRSMAMRPDGLCEVLSSEDFAAVKERLSGDFLHCDRSFPITIGVVSGTTISISPASGWAPKEGDLVVGGLDVYVVTSVGGATVFEVDRTGLTTGGATAYESIHSSVEFTAEVQGQPDAVKTWSRVQWLFQATAGLWRVSPTYSSDRDGSTDAEAIVLASGSDQRSASPRVLPHWVPRTHAWATRLYPRIDLVAGGFEAGAFDWLLEGVSLEAEIEGTSYRRGTG